VANPIHAAFPNQAARERFGLTLTLWLERGGWSHDIPLRWGKQVGFPTVADSTFNRLQRGKIEQPYPVTFIQFGIINERLARADYGLAADDPLLPRLIKQRAIEHGDGSAWRATDFFSHFIGELEAPAWALEQPLPTLQQATAASAAVLERFTGIAKQRSLSMPAAWQSLAALVASTSPPALDAAELEVLRNVLSGWHTWSPEQLRELIDLDGQMRVEALIDRWADSSVKPLNTVP
jgi:hypothetical protein